MNKLIRALKTPFLFLYYSCGMPVQANAVLFLPVFLDAFPASIVGPFPESGALADQLIEWNRVAAGRLYQFQADVKDLSRPGVLGEQ